MFWCGANELWVWCQCYGVTSTLDLINLRPSHPVSSLFGKRRTQAICKIHFFRRPDGCRGDCYQRRCVSWIFSSSRASTNLWTKRKTNDRLSSSLVVVYFVEPAWQIHGSVMTHSSSPTIAADFLPLLPSRVPTNFEDILTVDTTCILLWKPVPD